MRAFIFPGQGSQAVGMGQALAAASPSAKAVFQEVDDALGQHLFKLMCEGPESDLTLTENAQPAIMANAIATLRVLEVEGGVTLASKCSFVAGHSLGNILHSVLRAHLIWRRQPNFSNYAVRRCRRQFRSALAPWRRY